jgi:hypothetical protein
MENMTQEPLETAVDRFLEIARRMREQSDRSPEDVRHQFIAFYRDVRVEGANTAEDGDMLLLEWGAARITFPDGDIGDFRGGGGPNYALSETAQAYLGFTRQVFAAGDDEETEFDDEAVQMRITLVFGPATGDEPSSNLWITAPDEATITEGITRWRAVPFVADRLTSDASPRIIATVSHCG